MVSEAKFMEIRKLPGAELADFLPADRVVTSWGCAFVALCGILLVQLLTFGMARKMLMELRSFLFLCLYFFFNRNLYSGAEWNGIEFLNNNNKVNPVNHFQVASYSS